MTVRAFRAAALAALLWAEVATAAVAGLFEQPMLVLDPGMHVAAISDLDVDAAGRTMVTGSLDGTVRIWDADTGALGRTIRLPRGQGRLGTAYAVAMSPDGSAVAAGGWMRFAESDQEEQIYLFDGASGAMTARLDGLPNVVLGLAFSPDGSELTATLGGGFGMRLYRRGDAGWSEVARDEAYHSKPAQGVAFAPDGRFATTAYDGLVRLYDVDGRLLATADAGGPTPFGIAFGPDGRRLAVGHFGAPLVQLFDAGTLAPLPLAPPSELSEGDLANVAWSADGSTLYAGGTQHLASEIARIVAWDGAGVRSLEGARDTVFGLRGLPGGDLLVVSGDPWIGRLAASGERRWEHPPAQMDARDQDTSLAVSEDGSLVEFGYLSGGRERARFDVATLKLGAASPEDGLVAVPDQTSLAITGWHEDTEPRLLGRRLGMEDFEVSRSLAIAPHGGGFVLGSEWNLRAFDRGGNELWHRPAPGVAWALNISGDGRIGVGAFGDGTIRWFRMEDGVELLGLFPLPDRVNWVTWTPDGIYAATGGARSVLRWHVNRGWDAAGDSVPVSDILHTMRPEVLKRVLPQLGTFGALAATEYQQIRESIMAGTGSSVLPGSRLHVVSIGVSDYGPQAAHLNLSFAAQDARDLTALLYRTQTGRYAEVRPQMLLNADATRGGILRALNSARIEMAKGGGNDMAVVQFSGHGAMIDGRFYLLPYKVDARDAVTIADTALDAMQFQAAIARLAEYGRVVVLLDACRSGATTTGGIDIEPDGTRLRDLLRGPNIALLTSSTADQDSLESPEWGHGAFTAAILEGLTTRGDADGNGEISMLELTQYVSRRVPQLTGGRQTPGIDPRFDGDVFVAEM